VINKKLMSFIVFTEKIYNINKTKVLLSVLKSLKVLVSRYELKIYKEAGIKYN